MRFLQPLLDISLRGKIRSTDIRKQLGTERLGEEKQEYQTKWHNHVERMPLERLPQQTICLSLYWKTRH
jgi:hypothetical protein